MMQKIVRRQGNSLVIILDKQDREILGIEEGDIVEISDIVVLKKKSNARTKTKKAKRR